MSILEFNNVSFAYAGSSENVLEDINFSIEYGEFVILCGQSGCGKSTLLRHTKKNQIPEGICLCGKLIHHQHHNYCNQ